MKRFLKRAAVLAVFGVCCVWGAELLHCEYLTAQYADDALRGACQQHYGYGTLEKYKLLDYSKWGFAKIYAADGQSGYVFILTSDSENWQVVNWYTVWSKQGSADGLVWPYFR